MRQCRIYRDSGKEVLDVRELLITEQGLVPMLTSTKRLAFREVVRPGDGLLIGGHHFRRSRRSKRAQTMLAKQPAVPALPLVSAG